MSGETHRRKTALVQRKGMFRNAHDRNTHNAKRKTLCDVPNTSLTVPIRGTQFSFSGDRPSAFRDACRRSISSAWRWPPSIASGSGPTPTPLSACDQTQSFSATVKKRSRKQPDQGRQRKQDKQARAPSPTEGLAAAEAQHHLISHASQLPPPPPPPGRSLLLHVLLPLDGGSSQPQLFRLSKWQQLSLSPPASG